MGDAVKDNDERLTEPKQRRCHADCSARVPTAIIRLMSSSMTAGPRSSRLSSSLCFFRFSGTKKPIRSTARSTAPVTVFLSFPLRVS